MSSPDVCPPSDTYPEDETSQEWEQDRLEDRAEQWQRDYAEETAPNLNY